MNIPAQVEQINRQIEDTELLKQRATTQAEREEACEILKALKAEKHHLERLEKRYSPNQLKALEAMHKL